MEAKKHKPIEECEFLIDFEACSYGFWSLVHLFVNFRRKAAFDGTIRESVSDAYPTTDL